MTQHLREDEFSSILAGDARQEWLRHIKECPECTRTLEQGQHQIEQIRTLMVAAGTRPESYWGAQHARINARLEGQSQRSAFPLWRLSLATAALAAMMAVLALNQTQHPTVQPPRQEIAHLSDEQLMQEMEEVANSEVPAAMKPAHVLADDMEYHAATSPSQLHVNIVTSRQRR
jgi:hypothetical protein